MDMGGDGWRKSLCGRRVRGRGRSGGCSGILVRRAEGLVSA